MSHTVGNAALDRKLTNVVKGYVRIFIRTMAGTSIYFYMGKGMTVPRKARITWNKFRRYRLVVICSVSSRVTFPRK